MDCYLMVIIVALSPLSTMQTRVAHYGPNIVADSFISFEINDNKWTKFADLGDDAKSDILQVVEGGFVFTDLNEVQIHCEAPYPVEWHLENLQEVPPEFYSDIQYHTQRNGSLNSMPPESWTYTAVLALYLSQPFVSQNYSCRGLNGHRQANTFVYLSAKGQSLLAEAGQTFDIKAGGKSVVTLPCRLTNLDEQFQVILERKFEEHDLTYSWNLTSVNDSVVYDSRAGFLLTAKDLPNLVGEYRCRLNGTEIQETDAVHFRISNARQSNFTEDSLSPRMEMSGTAKFWYEDDERKAINIICCSDSKQPPQLRVISCNNPAYCKYVSTFLVTTTQKNEILFYSPGHGHQGPTANCSKAISSSDSIFIGYCKGEGINVLQAYQFSFRNANVVDFKDHGDKYMTFPLDEIEYIPTSKPITGDLDKMIKMVYFKSSETVEESYYGREPHPPPTEDNGLIHAKDFMFTGETVTFRCYYSTYVFVHGGYWKVKWKNGDTKLFYSDRVFEIRPYAVHQPQPHGILSLNLKLEKELESVTCACSVFNTSEWRIRETKVSVKDPVQPNFMKKEEEVTWTLHSKNVTLICDVSGSPVPKVLAWRKDGMEIIKEHAELMRIENGVQHRKSVLVVPEVSHEMRGEYSCTTENVAGTAEKVFKVYVAEGSSFTGWAVFGVGLSLVIFGGIAVVVWKCGIGNLSRMITKLSTS